MAFAFEKASKSSRDIRLPATSIIWGFAMGMLAICLPLSNDTDRGVVISIGIVSAATVSTVGIWRSSDKKSATSIEPPEPIKELQERIANLEMIATSNSSDWQRQIQPAIKSDSQY
jgi:hypothetical protein